MVAMDAAPAVPGQRKKINFSNLAVGGVMNLFEVSTLGQPFEVLKTQMASHRTDTIPASVRNVWARGGVFGFYQGLWPWALIEASTKGAVLLFTAAEVEGLLVNRGVEVGTAGLLAGASGGVAQAYATMGFCTCMKTAEITRSKVAAGGVTPPSTFVLFADMYRKGGIRGINKGVNAVALRQMTNWGLRLGFARYAEKTIRKLRGKAEGERLGALDRIGASAIGGAMGCINQPLEVVRVEMQSMVKSTNPNRPAKPTILNTLSYIYSENGIKGLYRGATPRIGLGIWQTICMVSFADTVKTWLAAPKA